MQDLTCPIVLGYGAGKVEGAALTANYKRRAGNHLVSNIKERLTKLPKSSKGSAQSANTGEAIGRPADRERHLRSAAESHTGNCAVLKNSE